MDAVYFLTFSGPDGSVTLKRRADCPPILQKGMGIGFEPHSTFNCDEFRINRIHWNCHLNEVRIELEMHRYENSAYSAASRYMEDWLIHLEIAFDELEECLEDWDENEGAGYAIVERCTKFYWVNKVELALLCKVNPRIVVHRNLTGFCPEPQKIS